MKHWDNRMTALIKDLFHGYIRNLLSKILSLIQLNNIGVKSDNEDCFSDEQCVGHVFWLLTSDQQCYIQTVLPHFIFNIALTFSQILYHRQLTLLANSRDLTQSLFFCLSNRSFFVLTMAVQFYIMKQFDL